MDKGKYDVMKEVNQHISLPQDPCWYAVRTKYKTEKHVNKSLEAKGIQTYLPLLKKTKRYSKKIKHLEIPLISCYIFVNITDQDRVKVLETEYTYHFIKTPGHSGIIPDEEINILRRVVGQAGDMIDCKPTDWREGQMVEIVAGTLTGLKGRLIKQKGKNHFIVSLSSIGYDIEMEVETNMLQQVSSVAY